MRPVIWNFLGLVLMAGSAFLAYKGSNEVMRAAYFVSAVISFATGDTLKAIARQP